MLFSATHPCVNLPNRQTLALAHDQMHSASAAVSLPCCHSNHFPLHLIGRAGLLFSGHADMSHMQCAEWLPRARRMTVFSHISICLQPPFPLDCPLDKPKTLKFYSFIIEIKAFTLCLVYIMLHYLRGVYLQGPHHLISSAFNSENGNANFSH